MSLRNPVRSADSFSMAAMADLRAAKASAGLMFGVTAFFILSVMSSMLMSTLSSRSGQGISSACFFAMNPSLSKSRVAVLSFCRESAPIWWLVMINPSAEIKLPEPPLLNLTDERQAFSSQGFVRLKLCFLLSRVVGGSLKSHMPSSENKLMLGMNPRRKASRNL